MKSHRALSVADIAPLPRVFLPCLWLLNIKVDDAVTNPYKFIAHSAMLRSISMNTV